MKIYDSSIKQKVPLIPINDNEVRMYICGPTVYDDAHLGHARSAISFDLLARFLEIIGYKVIVAKNFTDIDDKIINKSKQSNIPLHELTKEYISRYLQDMKAINVRRPNLEPKATEYIKEISNFIQALLDKDIAYKLPNGDICLDISKDPKYGSLSHHFDDRDSIHRVEVLAGKRDPRDFVLWKKAQNDSDIGYSSILDRGRPGWHIECSAMIDSALSYENREYCIDIHAGGLDLFFPHHENEACQTRCLRDKELAKYWMHNGFVNINGEKMSKSLGNSFFMKDALKIYHGEILRNYLISTHYRSVLNFNEEDLLRAKKRLDKIYRLKRRIDFRQRDSSDYMDRTHLDMLQSNMDKNLVTSIIDSLKDDLNVSLALSFIEEFIKLANEHLDSNPKNRSYKAKIEASLEFIDFALGFGMLSYVEYFQLGVSDDKKAQIESLLQERLMAKQNKDFAKADNIRDSLLQEGITIMDKAGGISEWEKTI